MQVDEQGGYYSRRSISNMQGNNRPISRDRKKQIYCTDHCQSAHIREGGVRPADMSKLDQVDMFLDTVAV